jgi:branched-chain amino acid transport system permease protein
LTELLQDLVDALSLGSLYALLALGIAVIFGIVRLLNFAHGELIMLGAYALWAVNGAPFAGAVALTIAMIVVAALAIERVAFRPLRGADPAVLLVTSFAVSFLLQNLALVVFGSRPKGVALPAWLADTLTVGDLRIQVLSVVTVVVTLALLAGLALFLQRTPLGIQLRAAAELFSTARLVGVRADRVIATAFVISGVLAAVASILLVAQGGTVTASMGTTPVLIAFVATIVGGMGSLKGAVIAGYLLGALTVVLQTSLPLEMRPYRDAFVYLAVLGMLVLRPQGLVVSRAGLERV